MLKNRIIPCLDVKDGRTVKGINFQQLIDAGDPVEQAKIYSQQGADELCFLDITASHENRNTLYHMVEEVAKNCFIPFTVGGGVKSCEDIRQLLLNGADKVAINSAAVKNPQIIRDAADKFGSQCIVCAVDVKQKGQFYEIYINGGRIGTKIDAINFICKIAQLGAGEILLTSMNRDGTKKGYDLDLIKKISSKINIPIIASGGVGQLSHLAEGIKAGASAVLAASIFHFKEFTILQAKEYLRDNNIPVRI